MIKSVVVFNNHGKPRLTKFYEHIPEDQQQKYLADCYRILSKRTDNQCNFLETSSITGTSSKFIFRNYATLFFIFQIDATENELGILDLIQVLVETLDQVFENVCELDLIFNMDTIHFILDEYIVGGLVIETNMKDVLEALHLQKLEVLKTTSTTSIASLKSMISSSTPK